MASSELGRFHRTRRISIAVLLGIVFVGLVFIHSMWSNDEIHDVIESIGFILIAGGILGRMWCVLYIGSRKSSELIATGPYSMTRNPLYLFSSIAACGVGAQSGSITIAVAFFIVCTAVFHFVIVAEERFLGDKFGAAYAGYLRDVPRFFPSFGRFRDSVDLTIKTRLVYRTFLDGLVFFLSIPVLEGVELLQAHHVVPVLLRLP